MRTFLASLLAVVVLVPALPGQGKPAADRTLKFELYKDKQNEFRWRLKAANGAELATAGQGYKRKADAQAGIDRIVADAAGDKLTFEVYEDKKQEHRWRLKAANGQVIAVSSEGYKAKADAEKAVELIKAGAKTAKVDDQTG